MALQRVTIGFTGVAQLLAVRIEDDALDELLQSVTGGDWHDLTVEDGTIRMNLGAVVFVRTEREEHRVGFGAA